MAESDIAGITGRYEKLGASAYLFRSETTTHEALISAHGGYERATKTFKVPPGMTIHFWAPHGYVLTDPGIKLMYTSRSVSPVESVKGGKECIDYALSKYQGKHGGTKDNPAETYTTIAAAIHNEDTPVVNTLKKLENAKDELEADRALDQMAYAGAMNVITIRNRVFRGNVFLSMVIAKLHELAPGINCKSRNLTIRTASDLVGT